ncbi:prolyl aminopeptidase [Marinobacterium rhizophilum]|uniref:Proline iminopeptidase n=1 Tax=Marinobacterium rhizophilum TaxID=420402 RepID=A0ABY5HJQ9_9GAMM|nr:prolyl aminopeptidase [Marinobacterium rhizophilum]UTW11196.1 prolyl aminopeptidase [Marinobacterium rhizophilum]
MRTLYPDLPTYAEHRLQVDQIHNLYVEESGSPQGIPVLFVHGGPGGGCSATHRRFFDPAKYRIILFDQRGCGRSRPHASLKSNTTAHLVDDMERIRVLLGIDRWLLFGGSWGSTLSLVYAQKHPERVCGLILRGIFLCRDQDLQWFYQRGANALFPDYWEHFEQPIPLSERGDMLNAYHRRLTADNEIARMSAAKAWSLWEGRCSTLDPNSQVVDHCADPHVALAMARIECHYFVNQAFLEPDQILRDAAVIRDIPTVIVQGRYDVVCPPEQAHALHQALPQAELHLVRDAGHSAFEPGIISNLVEATDDFARSLA